MDTLWIIIICLVFSFFASLFLTKRWILIAKQRGITGKDMNKRDKKKVADFGGIMPVITIVLALFLYIFFKTFVLKSSTQLVDILVITVTIILAGLIGFVNDILSLSMTKDVEIVSELIGKGGRGIGGWIRMLLTIPVALPLIVINAGHHFITVPILGHVWVGLAYPLVIVPIAIVGATNGTNLLAGYNGLESWLGVVIFFGFGVMSLITGQLWLVLVAAIVIFALLGFLVFNKYPSQVFPGDSLTFALGSLVACFAIVGNIEKFALILFIPFIIEGFLKWGSNFKAENFGKPRKDGSLKRPSKKIFSLTHLAIWIIEKIKPSHKAYEKEVILTIVFIEIIFIILGLVFM